MFRNVIFGTKHFATFFVSELIKMKKGSKNILSYRVCFAREKPTKSLFLAPQTSFCCYGPGPKASGMMFS